MIHQKNAILIAPNLVTHCGVRLNCAARLFASAPVIGSAITASRNVMALLYELTPHSLWQGADASQLSSVLKYPHRLQSMMQPHPIHDPFLCLWIGQSTETTVHSSLPDSSDNCTEYQPNGNRVLSEAFRRSRCPQTEIDEKPSQPAR